MKRLLSLVFVASMSAALMAEEISVDRALSMARQYITVSEASVAKSRSWAKSKSQAGQTANGRSGQSAGQSATPAYYVFEGEGGKGWAVVSTDDALGGVLAYSQTSAFDTTRNTAAAMMLRAYSKTYDQYRQTGEAPLQARARTFAKKVGPLMTTKWSQNYPYNRKLPNGYRFTGCGPTAMAQVMRFHEWPEKGHGAISYTNYYDMKTISDTLGHTYNWKKMLDSDDYYYLQGLGISQEEKDAAQLDCAQLMFDCGAFSECSYEGSSMSASWETNLVKALKTNFDYESSIFYQAQEGRQAFYEIVASEINSGFPVILSGFPKTGYLGHVFVGDGVDTDGRIHINYGWGDSGDGFYQFETITFPNDMKAVLAHPIGKAGSAPMPKELRDDAVHLHFSTDGYIRAKGLKADSAILRPDSIILHMANFTNLGNPFQGDLGVALVGESGDTVYVGGSESHANGGFTTKLGNGIFGTNNKIVDGYDVNVRIPLTGVKNGYYKVLPLAAAYNDSLKTYSPWNGLHVYPQFEIELTATTLRISEQGGPDGGYAQRLQIAGLPVWSKDSVKAGDNVSLSLPIDNIKGIGADGTLTVALFSHTTGDSLTAATTEVNIAGFYQDTIKVSLNIPATATDDAYRLRLTIGTAYRTDTVSDYHLNRPTYLLVGNATMPTPAPAPDPEPTPDPDPIPDPEPVVITLPESGFLAYSPDKDMRLEAWQSAGVTAYAVALDADSLILVAVDEVRKGEGVILKGAPQTKVEVPAEAATLALSVGPNLLVGVLSDTLITATTETTVNFRFVATDTLVSFQSIGAEGETIEAGGAYLALPAVTAEAVGAQDGLTLRLSDNGSGSLTGLASATKAQVATARDIIYDLGGRRIANPQRGIYIVNGRKVIFR